LGFSKSIAEVFSTLTMLDKLDRSRTKFRALAAGIVLLGVILHAAWLYKGFGDNLAGLLSVLLLVNLAGGAVLVLMAKKDVKLRVVLGGLWIAYVGYWVVNVIRFICCAD